MASKLNYDSKSLLNIKFSPCQKGYDPLEVDQIFDNIIKDYEIMAKNLNEAINKNEQQASKIEELKKELDRVSFELTSLKNKFNELKKTSNVNEDNYSLVKKVNAYERVLYKKGINPKKALSDPDNC